MQTLLAEFFANEMLLCSKLKSSSGVGQSAIVFHRNNVVCLSSWKIRRILSNQTETYADGEWGYKLIYCENNAAMLFQNWNSNSKPKFSKSWITPARFSDCQNCAKLCKSLGPSVVFVSQLTAFDEYTRLRLYLFTHSTT